MIRLLRRIFHRQPPAVSTRWLQDQRQRERVAFDGVSWRWPVNRRLNDASAWNRRRLRKSA